MILFLFFSVSNKFIPIFLYKYFVLITVPESLFLIIIITTPDDRN